MAAPSGARVGAARGRPLVACGSGGPVTGRGNPFSLGGGSGAIQRKSTLSVVEPELLDLAGDRVAADAELLRGLNAPPSRDLERRVDQLRLELAGQRVPDLGLASQEQPARVL